MVYFYMRTIVANIRFALSSCYGMMILSKAIMCILVIEQNGYTVRIVYHFYYR